MIMGQGSGDTSSRGAELDLMYLSRQGELIQKLIRDHDFENWSDVPTQEDGQETGFPKALEEAASKMCTALCGIEQPSWDQWLAGVRKGHS